MCVSHMPLVYSIICGEENWSFEMSILAFVTDVFCRWQNA